MKKLLKAASWVAAPKMMFAAKNPKKAALLKAGTWAMSRVPDKVLPAKLLPTKKRTSPGATAAKGLGAAAVALPVGMWLGRKVLRRGENEMNANV
jgi:hypothetical protein